MTRPGDIDEVKREEEINELIEKYEFSVNKKKKKSLMLMSNESFETFRLCVLISKSCKEMDPETAMKLYLTAKSSGIKPNLQTYTQLINLLAGLGELSPNHNVNLGPVNRYNSVENEYSSDTEIQNLENQENLPNKKSNRRDSKGDFQSSYTVFQDMKEQGLAIPECVYTAIIRSFCLEKSNGQQSENSKDTTNEKEIDVMDLYEEMKSSGLSPKLRTFSPLLLYYSALGDIQSTFKLYDEMTQEFQLIPLEKDYANVLSVTSIHRDSRFYQVLNAMMEDIVVPELSETIKELNNWFRSELVNQSAYSLEYSKVDSRGKVACNGEQLLSLDFDEPTRTQFVQQLESFALDRDENKRIKLNNKILKTEDTVTQSTVDNKGKKRYLNDYNDRDFRIKVWEEFKSKIGIEIRPDGRIVRTKNEFNIVVDGANVGYYKQNFVGAPDHVDYHQIDHVLKCLKRQNLRPIVFLHSRHRRAQMIPNEEVKSMIHSWGDLVYWTPKGFNDDWFWLFASVSTRCKVVTNDEMRDHHFQLLSPRWFGRWRQQNRVQFNFAIWKEDKGTNYNVSMPSSSADSKSSEPSPPSREWLNREEIDKDKKDRVEASQLCKRVRLIWPKPYSFAMQNIQSNELEGYYFPINQKLQRELKDQLPDISDGILTEGSDDGVLGPEGCHGVRGHEIWLCIYRKIKNTSPAQGEVN